MAAVVGLGRTLSRQAAPNLITALGDDSDSVRKAAEYHLGTIASILEKKRRFAGQFGLEEGKDK
jgi:HEAT repeat protein